MSYINCTSSIGEYTRSNEQQTTTVISGLIIILSSGVGKIFGIEKEIRFLFAFIRTFNTNTVSNW